jgi:hypothetical protein
MFAWLACLMAGLLPGLAGWAGLGWAGWADWAGLAWPGLGWLGLQRFFWLCIAGAFTKFAIFENRNFFKRDAAE